MNKIDMTIWVLLLGFIVVNIYVVRKNNWNIEQLKKNYYEQNRRIFYVKNSSTKEEKIYKQIVVGLRNAFTLNSKNSRLIFFSLIGLVFTNLSFLSAWIKLVIVFISLATIIYVGYDRFTNSVKNDYTLGIGALLYLPLIGLLYASQFMTVIEDDNKVNFTILILSLLSILISLFFSFSIASIVLSNKFLKFTYVSICFIGALFLGYAVLGYSLLGSKYGFHSNNFFINTPSDSTLDLLVFLVSHGYSKVNNIPELVFNNEVNSSGIKAVTQETLKIHLIGIAFLTIFTSINLGYLSRILFQKPSSKEENISTIKEKNYNKLRKRKYN